MFTNEAELNQAFDVLFPDEGAPSAPEDPVGVALDLFYEGSYAHCLEALSRSKQPQGAEDPRVVALGAACRALVRGRLRPAIRACTWLVERGVHSGDSHCALGVVLLKGRRRAQAREVFLRGLGTEPGHPALRAQVERMGIRREPVLRFLPRAHPANRLLGLLRARVRAP